MAGRKLDIAHARLVNQQLTSPRFRSPADVVSWMGAIQAQDFPAALWAIGLRMPAASEEVIEKAIADRTIVRTWPMRHTLHFVAAQDVRWMLELLGPRASAGSSLRHRQLHLDSATFARSARTIAGALRGGRQLTREAIYRLLEESHISPAGQRGIHILSQLSQEGLLCFGARQGKHQTFVLLDEWVAATRPLHREEALAELSIRFFASHGPATVQDFAWWSGLTAADARSGLEMVKARLDGDTIDGLRYHWMRGTGRAGKGGGQPVILLPAFDEYLVAYRNRSALLRPQDAKRINAGGGMLSPSILVDGRVAGTWRRMVKKEKIFIETARFFPFTKDQQSALGAAVRRYAAFVGREPGSQATGPRTLFRTPSRRDDIRNAKQTRGGGQSRTGERRSE